MRLPARRPPIYRAVAGRIEGMIDDGTFRPGDRIPSVRELSRQLNVSVNTVVSAYSLLESQRRIEARPQAGYYVRGRLTVRRLPVVTAVTAGDLRIGLIRRIAQPELAPLGQSAPPLELLPVEALNRMLGVQARRLGNESVGYAPEGGGARLRAAIARRSLSMGYDIRPGEIVITSGCMEAITLALRATCKAGDTVAIAAPVFYTFLSAIQALGLRVLEIPADPRTGVSLEVLRYVLGQTPVHACLLIPNFSNPTGSLMPEESKRALVEMLGEREIPLIEDDVYGDLGFEGHRPRAARAYDERGLVITCSSFSKTLAPGFRVGWMAAGRYQGEVERLKLLTSGTTASPTQLAVAEFLTNGGYDRHLRKMRRAYAERIELLRRAILRQFPKGTKVTRPRGGPVVWVELPAGADALTLCERALFEGISIAPGPLFTTGDGFRNCLRLNAAHWSVEVERLVGVLAGLCRGGRD